MNGKKAISFESWNLSYLWWNTPKLMMFANFSKLKDWNLRKVWKSHVQNWYYIFATLSLEKNYRKKFVNWNWNALDLFNVHCLRRHVKGKTDKCKTFARFFCEPSVFLEICEECAYACIRSRLWHFKVQPQCLHTRHKHYTLKSFISSVFYVSPLNGWREKKSNKTRIMYCSIRQIRKSLLAQWSLKQIFGGFIVRDRLLYIFLFLFRFGFCLFVEHVCCVPVLDDRCLPKANRRTVKKAKDFFVSFDENLKWFRWHRHIPSVEYFMQNANKAAQNTWVYWFNQHSFGVFGFCYSIYPPIFMPMRWTMASADIFSVVFSRDNMLWSQQHYHRICLSLTFTGNCFQTLETIVRNTFCKLLSYFKTRRSAQKWENCRLNVEKWWRRRGVIERTWPPIYWYGQIDFCTLMCILWQHLCGKQIHKDRCIFVCT